MAYYDFYSQRKVTKLSRKLNEGFAKRNSRKIMGLLQPGGSVLEIGTGEGPVAKNLHPQYKYTGYEPNPALAARMNADGIFVHAKTVPPLLEKDGSQDVVVAIHVLEHMTDVKEAQVLLDEIRRVLAAGGHLFLICPDFLDFGPTFYDADYSHSFVTTRNRLSQMLVDSGFTLVENHFIYGPFDYFPGVFCNLAVKLVFLMVHPIRKLFAIENMYTAKLQYTFARSVFFICRKKEKI
jgi:2-polyprenyl-3-methyl-5-hydroxy-6-metoxy-1,4-benzoquinol methylase